MFNKILLSLALIFSTGAFAAESTDQTQAPTATAANPFSWMMGGDGTTGNANVFNPMAMMMPMMGGQQNVGTLKLATPEGWTVFTNPGNYAAFMNPATYGQFMKPEFYLQFADPKNMAAWMNPAAYGQFMNPNAYMQMMNPMAYMQFMNPGTYTQAMNPAAYSTFMDPNTYMQWANPATFTTAAQGATAGFNWFDPKATLQAPSEQSQQQ
ncbi:MAG: hypothetical protein GY820_32915 [Gammaproteobacteria bacterium]|nr:hypothetical protein [Gammaproteobacteria bacterium]